VEFGSGDSAKHATAPTPRAAFAYVPVDISADALGEASAGWCGTIRTAHCPVVRLHQPSNFGSAEGHPESASSSDQPSDFDRLAVRFLRLAQQILGDNHLLSGWTAEDESHADRRLRTIPRVTGNQQNVLLRITAAGRRTSMPDAFDLCAVNAAYRAWKCTGQPQDQIVKRAPHFRVKSGERLHTELAQVHRDAFAELAMEAGWQ